MSVDVADRRYVRVVDGRVEWRCLACDTWSLFASDACEGCERPRGQLVSTADVSARAGAGVAAGDAVGGVHRAVAVTATVIAPGAGHVVLGRTLAGFTRLVIAGAWLAAGLHWALGDVPAARLAGGVLLAGVGMLWVTTLADVRAVTRREQEPVGARGLLWLVVLVTVALAGVVAAIVAGAPPG